MAYSEGCTYYALGFIQSAKLEIYPPEDMTKVHEPTLVINATMTERIQSKTTGWIEKPMAPQQKRIIIPFDELETQKQCEHWITREMVSMGLSLVTAEIENPGLMMRELIWNMKEKWEAGEMCNAVAEMDWIEVTEPAKELVSRVLEVWVNHMIQEFKGMERSSCVVCLDDLDEKSQVLELQCGHVFHSGCVWAWLRRRPNCPSYRSPVDISFRFWVHRRTSDLSDPLSQLSFPCLSN